MATGAAAALIITDAILVLVERMARLQEMRQRAHDDAAAEFSQEKIAATRDGNAAADDAVQDAFNETYGKSDD